jgi:DNA-binding transcriptional ArsR family regulator
MLAADWVVSSRPSTLTLKRRWKASCNPVRVAIYAEMAGAACTNICSNFLQISDRSIPTSTLSQHFRGLREAGLVRSERRGVEMHNTSRCMEIEQRFPGLLPAILKAHGVQSAAIKRKQTTVRKRAG